MNEVASKEQVRKVRLWILGIGLALIALLIVVGAVVSQSSSDEVDIAAPSVPLVESAAPIAPVEAEPTTVESGGDAAACQAAGIALTGWANDDLNLLQVSEQLSQAAQLTDGAVRESLANLSQDAAGTAAAQAVDEDSVSGAMDEFSAVLDFVKAWESALAPCADAGSPLPAP